MKLSTKIFAVIFTLLASNSLLAQLALESSYEEKTYRSNGTDYTAPRTDLLRPALGEFVYGPTSTLEFKVIEDESGVKTTYFKVGDLPYMQSKGDRMLPARLEDGGYRILYYSVDQSGNQEQLRYDEIFVDKAGPAILSSFSELPESFSDQGLPIYARGTRLQIQVVDERVDVKRVTYQINGGEPIEAKGTIIDLKARMKSADDAVVEVSVKAIDELGNANEEKISYQIRD